MAKRFIDTGILKHHFTRSLEGPLKLLWVHLLTDCNAAGMWQVDWEVAEIFIGGKIDREKAMKAFENKVVILKNGAIWFIPDFIEYQYNTLQEKNPAHRNIILLLQKENLITEDLKLKPLPSPSGVPSKGTMVMVKEKVKEKVKGVQGEKIEEAYVADSTCEAMDHPYVEKIKSEYRILLKVTNPLTNEEAERLERDIGDEVFYDKLMGLANRKDVLKKYNSVNLTIRNWVSLDKKKNGSTKSDSGTERIGRMAVDDLKKIYVNTPR